MSLFQITIFYHILYTLIVLCAVFDVELIVSLKRWPFGTTFMFHHISAERMWFGLKRKRNVVRQT